MVRSLSSASLKDLTVLKETLRDKRGAKDDKQTRVSVSGIALIQLTQTLVGEHLAKGKIVYFTPGDSSDPLGTFTVGIRECAVQGWKMPSIKYASGKRAWCLRYGCRWFWLIAEDCGVATIAGDEAAATTQDDDVISWLEDELNGEHEEE